MARRLRDPVGTDFVIDLDLLRLEMDTLWGEDVYGRPLTPHPLAAVAVAKEGRMVRLGPSAPAHWTVAEDGPSPPPEMSRWQAEFAASSIRGGPSYLIERETLAVPPTPADLRVLVAPIGYKVARPEPWWEPEEWTDLLEGRLGPVALGLREGRVVTLCHTPRASESAAEAGTWTHPNARGQGLAGVVTAAWAEVAGRRFETLFYSTSFENAASQAVARKLGLRPIGAIWQLWSEPA